MVESTRLLLSLENPIMDKIDKVVKAVNETKEIWRRPANRQSVLRGLIRFALEQDVSYSSGYTKYVTVRHKKK